MRKNDRFYWDGGEEFVVVFKEIDVQEAKRLLDQLNEDMKKACYTRYGLEDL
ncbi:hypothetical protein [Acidaminobacter sp. JC074]|uniref:hypothetical protein n=1 Tax=Acidaminobacter sp. JC074 TaxID=2530199 RepID=UPI001F0F5C78|nr:hypothetical protein [Acidaminobacter sp. JC074]